MSGEAKPRHVGMPSDKPRTLREALKDIPTDDEQTRILIELGDSDISDEATVIVGGTILEIALRNAIIRHFRQGIVESENLKLFNFENNGPLADFSAKIKLAYALGIGKEETRDDLDKIRLIRNYFAHTPRIVSLSDAEVISIVNNLNVTKAATLLEIAGLNDKQRYSYAISRYHYSLRLYFPNSPEPYPWSPMLP
jgi:DNA-binding MltR family transcriptional regulator